MRSFFSNLATRLRRDQRGATAVEYGIMVSLIAVVIIIAVTALGGTLATTFESVQCSVSGKDYTAAVPASTGVTAVASSCN